jgi:hypothetical protein
MTNTRTLQRRPLWPVLTLALAAITCAQPTPATPVSAGPATPAATATVMLPLVSVPRATGFTIAAEYGVPGLAALYAGAGLTSAKPQIEFGVWGNLEPEPGVFNWEPLDRLVAEYQAAGFEHLQLLISADSPWAATTPRTDPMPRDEFLDDYTAFVRRFVERYDGDGLDDAPDLLYGIHDYGIEREFTGYFGSSAADYVRLLRLAYPEIHAADPDANVLLVAILMIDVFDGAPDAAEIERRLATRPPFRKSVDDIRAILAACDAYDVVDFHALGHYTEIPPTAAWLRAELAAAGCDRPLWIGDAFSMSVLLAYNQQPFAPATPATRDAVAAVLQAAADPAAPDHAAAWDWQQAEAARGLVKKAVVAAGARLLGINLGNLEDWASHIPAIDKALVLGMGTSVFMGMADSAFTFERYGELPYEGDTFALVRRAGATRPAYYALGLAAGTLGAHTAVTRLEGATLATDPAQAGGVWAFAFSTPAGPTWVLWYDDGALHLPGDAPPAINVTLPVGAESAVVTRTPITANGAPAAVAVAAPGGVLSLALDSTPVLSPYHRRPP